MFWPGQGAGGWGLAVMVISMAVFWGLVIGGGALLARAVFRGTGSGAGGRPSAEQLLAERFARGEIDEEEYRHRRDVLAAIGQAASPGPRP
jgi:putative membrane protein